MENDVWQRIYFNQPCEKPFLFYVLFGTNGMSRLAVSKDRHNMDGVPDELEVINYHKSDSLDDKKFIENFYTGNLGKVLKEKSSALYEKVAACDNLTIVKGEFGDCQTLHYLKNSIGITQAIIETGVTAVLDMQILEWFEPHEWSAKFFVPKVPNVLEHVKIFLSVRNGDVWLRTRGMRKFGRPDLSIKKVNENKKEQVHEIVKHFIQSCAFGLMPDETKPIKLSGMEEGVTGKILGGYDDFDFNNYYLEIEEI